MKGDRKIWTEQEDQAIISLVKKYGSKKWSNISERMKERFPEEGRSGKQCRQRWHNHLSPLVSKQPWNQQELKNVFQAHQKHGNKWTEIAQLLPGRTDNAVKNQFYSTLRKGLRRICKVLGTRNSTTRIKKIKPSALSTLLSNINQIQLQSREKESELYDILFEYSKGEKFEGKSVSEQEKQKLEMLLESILDSKDLVKKKRSKLDNCVKGRKLKENQMEGEKEMQFEPFEFPSYDHVHGNEDDQQYVEEQSLFPIKIPQLKLNKSFSNYSNQNEISLLKKKSSSGSKSFNKKKLSYKEQMENENYIECSILLEKSPKGSGEKGIRTSPMKVTPHEGDSAHQLFSYFHMEKNFDQIVEEKRKEFSRNTKFQ